MRGSVPRIRLAYAGWNWAMVAISLVIAAESGRRVYHSTPSGLVIPLDAKRPGSCRGLRVLAQPALVGTASLIRVMRSMLL